jgi:type VI secretion system protein ImpM
MMNGAGQPPGFYGKLPARGDFLGRRLSRAFTNVLDGWLQESIAASRETLGERWLDLYLVSPLWRFVVTANACGPKPAAGILIPSVDTVGRYFPLMVGLEMDPPFEAPEFVAGSSAWFDSLESLALAALDPEFDLAAFDRPLALAQPTGVRPPRAKRSLDAPGRHIAVGDGEDLGAAAAELISACQGGDEKPASYWWTTGSDRVAPCCLACPGLPSPRAFTALLDGEFAKVGCLMDEI